MAFYFRLYLCRSSRLIKMFCAIMVTIIIINVLVSLFNVFSVTILLKSTKHSLRSPHQRDSISRYFQNENVHLLSQTDVTANNNSTNGGRKLRITADDFWNGYMTGNSLIDDYGKNNINNTGEMGRGVTLTADDKMKAEIVMSEYNVNTIVSDMIPLNRLVPDSRITGCEYLSYNTTLPSASVIIPFYNEWPSILLRSVYSIINRSPRRLLKEIILIDDASTLANLQQPLEDYIANNFPQNLVRLLRMPERLGLISARMRGCREATGDVLIIFDSHMEVNIEWLPPLLTEIAQDRTSVAMATLDYIKADTFKYTFNYNYLIRYGWDWKLEFFETFFRQDQIVPKETSPRLTWECAIPKTVALARIDKDIQSIDGHSQDPRGVTMVGAAFAIDRKYFFQLGGYDEQMKVWGGENLEMAWRVWLCGGRLLHVPCSRTGHIARSQPYTFPGGRKNIQHFNYKRAIDVWMGNYSRFAYHLYPDMRTIDVGDIADRLALKAKLGCKDFGWYLRNVWPELNVPDETMTHWGEVVNEGDGRCLDNNGYLFQAVSPMYISNCSSTIYKQAFSLTTDSLLRTSLQCVVANNAAEGTNAELQDCIIGTRDKWNYMQVCVMIFTNLPSSEPRGVNEFLDGCRLVVNAGPFSRPPEVKLVSGRWHKRTNYEEMPFN